MSNNVAEPCSLWIVKKCPKAECGRAWKNFHSRTLPVSLTLNWYVTVHDIVRTKDHIAAIHLTPTNACPNCGQEDSIQHKITDHMELDTDEIGDDTRLERELYTKDLKIRPTFTLWPPQRHAAVLWILANLVHYRLQTDRRLSLSEFMDFLRRSFWKLRPLAGTIANGEISGSSRVNGPMDSNLGGNGMPGRISPQPAAPHHGPQRMYTP